MKSTFMLCWLLVVGLLSLAQEAVDSPIEVSQANASQNLTNKVSPTYPALAMAARIQGSVRLAVVISKTGSVDSVTVVSGHPMLVPSAVEAVKKWQYKPFLVDGQPVAVKTEIEVPFSLGISAIIRSPSHQPHEPITEDLSHGATFTFNITPDLPEFTFKVIPEPYARDEFGNPHTTVREVQVFRGDSKEPVQSLEDCALSDMEAPPRGYDWFRAVDINFDGYKDIYMLTGWGATGNQSGCVWLYDPEGSRFEFSKDFSELGRFTLDPATKSIVTHDNGGMAGTIFRAAKYVIEDNRPVAVATVAQDWDFDKKEYHCVVQQRQGRAMETVWDEWAKPKNDFDAPCDASNPFRGCGDR